MDAKTTIDYFSEIAFLKDLPDLNLLQEKAIDGFYKKGEFLFKEGDVGKTMYIITSGCLEIFKENRVIAKRSTGEYIGEMALLGNKIRSASARTITDVKTIEIHEENFLKLLSLNPQAFLPLFETLAHRWKEDLGIIDSDNLELKKQIQLNKKYSRLLDDTYNEIFILEQDTYRILQANSKAIQNLGYTDDELKKTVFNDIFQNLTWDELSEKFSNLITKKQVQVSFECESKKKDGSTYPVEVRIQYFELENPPLIYAIVEDISDKKAMELHIKELAFYDSLTHLPNRNLIKDRLNIMLARAKRYNTKVAILSMDLDNFKAVNDSLGHDAGDQFLIQIANRFKGTIMRKEDTFGRLGGDDFIILLPNLKDEKFAVKMAQRVIDMMKQPLELKEKLFHSNFSIGIALFPDDGEDIEALFKNSDIAMYHAKESGGQAYRVYNSSMHEKIISRLALEQDLRKAIENKEFEVYYQPKVNLKTGKIDGLEALIRWHHSGGKNISPAVFIPIAEESRIINMIGDFTFLTACRQIREWCEKYGEAVKIGINLSGREFDQPNLVEKIRAVIKSENIDTKYLEIEVTETAVMTNIQSAIDVLQQLRELGIQISIDDFGAGYTSLGYLKKLPINTLKIDQSFICDCTDKSNAAIIQGIITISRKMGFKTIAEGVETQEQHDFLKGLECDQFQGYLCSKALPSNEISRLIWPD
jgi:diguanylate cyclase (GGDEF)-like protein/PAS domain S-box-containing protein